jgi:hypothetical protein
LDASDGGPFLYKNIGVITAVFQISGRADNTNNLENNKDKGNDNE